MFPKSSFFIASQIQLSPVHSTEVLAAGGTGGIAPVVEGHPLVLLCLLKPAHLLVAVEWVSRKVQIDLWSVFIIWKEHVLF